jgi:D-3-phosphoglycerate dehydrogenase
MRVLVSTTKWHPSALERLKERGAQTLIVESGDPGEIRKAFAEFDPDAALSRMHPIDADAIEAAPSLRIIAKHGTGVDNVDLNAATQRKVAVMFSLGANSRSVAEHAFGLIFALARNTAYHDRHLRSGQWTRFGMPAHELAGKRVGLVGFGTSAQYMADMARAVGMEVATFSPRYRHGPPPDFVRRAESLQDLLAHSDIVSLHCSLNHETRGLMSAEAFAAMPSGAWLINTARGGVVVEEAMMQALESGHLARAALDCHAQEPLPPDHPILRMDNVVLTPHVAGSTLQSARRTGATAVDNVLKYLSGQPIDRRMVANPDVLDE